MTLFSSRLKTVSASASRVGQQRGVTLWLVILILGMALAASLGASALVLGEIQQTRVITDSVTAFFAADAGSEQALYQLCKQNIRTDQSNQPIGAAQYSYRVQGGASNRYVVSTGSFRNSRRAIELTGFTESAGRVDCGASAAPFSFTLSNSGNITLPLYYGSGGKPTVESTITATLTSGPPQPVSLSLTNDPFIPTGVTATFSPSSCTPSPTCTSQLRLTNGGAFWAGWWTAKISGTAGAAASDTNFLVTIPAPACTYPFWTSMWAGDSTCSFKAYQRDFSPGGSAPYYWYVNDYSWGGPTALSTTVSYLDPGSQIINGVPTFSTALPFLVEHDGQFIIKVYKTSGTTPGQVACTDTPVPITCSP